MHKIPVGVLGASGYAGRELCALVAGHPRLELAFAAAHERRGERARIAGRDVTFVAADDAPLGDVAVVFSALPHGTSEAWAGRARSAGAKVVDLSADLRPGNGGVPETLAPATIAVAERAIGTASPTWSANGAGSAVATSPADMAALVTRVGELSAVYGLPELMREQIHGADVVANPGCYPTATLIALLPLLQRGLIPAGATIAVSAASGVTGAGFTPRHDLLFGEVTENFRAYGAGNTHRHLGEMRSTLDACGTDADLVFTPHLLPVARGILATITVPVRETIEHPLALWRDTFANEPFVQVSDELPALRDVVGRNVARVTAVVAREVRRPTLVLFAAIDNLVKGAAGQAVQNANLMLGLDERAGLAA